MSVCFLGLSIMFIVGQMFKLFRHIFVSSLTAADLTQLTVFALPNLVLYALPLATLIGVLLAFMRLNSDNELIALRAAGISFGQFLPSVLCILSLISVISFVNTLWLMPASNEAFAAKVKTLGRAGISALLQEGTFIDAIPKFVFFFQSVNPSTLSIEGIFVQDQRQPEVRLTIIAQRAQITYQEDADLLIFNIFDGIVTRVADNQRDAQTISFRSYNLKLSMDELFGDSDRDSKGRREMTLTELYHKVRIEGDRKAVRYALELHSRLALPLSCLLFGLIGAPLGAIFDRKARLAGITLGLVTYLAYYMVLTAGSGLGKNGIVPPFIAVWTPNALSALLAICLWTRLHNDRPFRPRLLRGLRHGHSRGIFAAYRNRRGAE